MGIKMKILVTGSDGLLGHAFRRISETDQNDFIFVTRSDGDLRKEECVQDIMETHKPNIVIHAAARVGGINANITHQAGLFYDNILMNTYMMHYAHKLKIDHFIAYSSVCSFGANCSVLKEELQHQGDPHWTNFAYAYAKRMIDIQARSYRETGSQTMFTCLIPTNLYGPNDNFNLHNSHVIPALIHKCYLSIRDKIPLVVWGRGLVKREFLYSRDLADITMSIIKKNKCFDRLLISGQREISIKEIINMIVGIMEYDRDVHFDISKTEGQNSRTTDTSVFKTEFPSFKFTDYENGLSETCQWFKDNYEIARK